MKRIILGIVILLVFTGFKQDTDNVDTNSNKPYNVLFIAVDDLNDWVGCLGGNPQTKTPNMDKLAASGALFTNAHCPAPMCGPSRTALMTGIRPYNSGNYNNPNSIIKNEVLNKTVGLPQFFNDNGYFTMGTGKLYHERHFREETKGRGFDVYWPSKTNNYPNVNYPDGFKKSQPMNGIPGKASWWDWGVFPDGFELEDTYDGKSVQWATEQLQKKYDKPFFLGVGIKKPHLPWYAPKKYFDMFSLGSIKLPNIKEDDLKDTPEHAQKITASRTKDFKTVREYDEWRKGVQAYLATIAYVDDLVGMLLTSLENSPYRDNTIVVLWSDHGWHLGEKLHWSKYSLWEEATKNVLMWRVPGITKPGSKCDAAVNLIDIYPTLVDLCQLPDEKVKHQFDGYKLTELLKNPSANWDKPTLTTYGYKNHSIRSKEWRYTVYADGSEELYDHRNDPEEYNNLAANPDFEKVKKDLAKWLPKQNLKEGPNTLVKKGSEDE